MKTIHPIENLEWHLLNNVQPFLNSQTRASIRKTVEAFNAGELTLSSPIHDNTNVTVGEMFEDLKIEVE